MSIDFQKCDWCKECYPDCGDNYPMSINGTDKYICPKCLNNLIIDKQIKLTYCPDCGCPSYKDENGIKEDFAKEMGLISDD